MSAGPEGRARGLEPPNGGATSHCLNHLATPAAVFANVSSEPAGLSLRLTSPSSRALSPLLAVTAVVAGIAGLVSTNPGPAEFEQFAADKLTELASDELCRNEGLPMLARLLIQNCPALVRSQRQVLGRLAREHTRRYNFGILSLYGTRLGGEQVLPNWRIPRYDAITLAMAGRFVLLTAGESEAGSPLP